MIDGIDDEVLERLRRRAEGNDRSFEGELREILLAASMQLSTAEARVLVDRLRIRLEGRPHGDSTEMIREDRDR